MNPDEQLKQQPNIQQLTGAQTTNPTPTEPAPAPQPTPQPAPQPAPAPAPQSAPAPAAATAGAAVTQTAAEPAQAVIKPKPLVITAQLGEVPPPAPEPLHPAQPMAIPQPVVQPAPIIQKVVHSGKLKFTMFIAVLALLATIGVGTYLYLELQKVRQDVNAIKQAKIDEEKQKEEELKAFNDKIKESSACSKAKCPEDCEEEYCECYYYDEEAVEHKITCRNE